MLKEPIVQIKLSMYIENVEITDLLTWEIVINVTSLSACIPLMNVEITPPKTAPPKLAGQSTLRGLELVNCLSYPQSP